MADAEQTVSAPSKPLIWVGSSLRDLKSFPRAVQRVLGHALQQAQLGLKPIEAKPLKGYRGSGVLELVEDYDGDTYRAIYTVRLPPRIYVLHAFQKKAKKGSKTPKHELDMINRRLQRAVSIHAKREDGDE